MRGKLLLFGGTAEGRRILEYGLPALCCVVTEYGAAMLRGLENAEILVRRLNPSQMSALIKERGVSCVIDATHPYASEVTANIKNACLESGVPLRRVLRARSLYGDALVVGSCSQAAAELNNYEGSVLLTTGSKDLAAFREVINFSERIFARLLPSAEIVARAQALGFKKEHLITAQGPFTAEENEDLLRRTGAEIIVTKDGGVPGGMEEKLAAARKLGVRVIVIARPGDAGGTVGQAVLWARRYLGCGRPPLFPMCVDIEKEKVVVVGGGTVALRRAALFERCGAAVTVVAPRVLPQLEELAFEIIGRAYREGDLRGAGMAVAATDDPEVNGLVKAEAERLGILANRADLAEDSDFFFPSVIEHGGVTLSVSSAGLSPKLTKKVSDKIRNVFQTIVEETKKEPEISQEGEQWA